MKIFSFAFFATLTLSACGSPNDKGMPTGGGDVSTSLSEGTSGVGRASFSSASKKVQVSSKKKVSIGGSKPLAVQSSSDDDADDMSKLQGSQEQMIAAAPAPKEAPKSAPKNRVDTQPITQWYRGVLPDRALTNGGGQPSSAYFYDGVRFVGSPNLVPGVTKPLYQCSTPRLKYSSEQGCEGKGTNQGVTTHIFINQLPGTMPLYRCTYGGRTFASTTDLIWCASTVGWTLEGITGFVLPPSHQGPFEY